MTARKAVQSADKGVRVGRGADELGGVETGEQGQTDNTLRHGWPAALKCTHRGVLRGLVPRPLRLKALSVALGVLVPASGMLTAWLYFCQYRPDEQIGAGAADAAVAAASEGTVALLSYSPETVDQDITTARTHLTGDYLAYYGTFTQQIIAPAAKQKSVKTTATVLSAAVSEQHPGSAVVLVFVNQSTTSKDSPDPSTSASSVRVTLNKVDGKWLISKFDPV